LAEVLITLGIIGVVAAMTLPVIQTKMDERANMTSLKKFYTEFLNATNLLVFEEDIPEYWGLRDNDSESSDIVMNLYKSRLSMIKTCSQSDSSCFPFPIYGSDGTEKITAEKYTSWAMRGFILNNGTTVCFDVNNGWFSVFFDVNGFKPPNKLGTDVFVWAVNSKGKIVNMNDDPSINSEGKDDDYNFAFIYMANGWKKP
jgi:type II secretory pathway pseudopilin PulG